MKVMKISNVFFYEKINEHRYQIWEYKVAHRCYTLSLVDQGEAIHFTGYFEKMEGSYSTRERAYEYFKEKYGDLFFLSNQKIAKYSYRWDRSGASKNKPLHLGYFTLIEFAKKYGKNFSVNYFGFDLTITPIQLTYKQEDLEKWNKGDRFDCKDLYINSMNIGKLGFGEYIAGRFFESLGYKYIYRDFNVFGGNKSGKWLKSEEILINFFGKEKFDFCRTLYSKVEKIQEPNLLIYKEDGSELFFVECKRMDTSDSLNIAQIRGLQLLSLLLNVKVYVCEIVEERKVQPVKKEDYKVPLI